MGFMFWTVQIVHVFIQGCINLTVLTSVVFHGTAPPFIKLSTKEELIEVCLTGTGSSVQIASTAVCTTI